MEEEGEMQDGEYGYSILVNDGILPSQYADSRRPSQPYEPERRMWRAAFESHLRDCQPIVTLHPGWPGRKQQRIRLDALEWLMSDSYAVMSLRWYADILGLDAEAVRAKVLSAEVRTVKRRDPVLV